MITVFVFTVHKFYLKTESTTSSNTVMAETKTHMENCWKNNSPPQPHCVFCIVQTAGGYMCEISCAAGTLINNQLKI